MQEALSRLTNETAESVQRTVSVVINSHLQVLSGNWKWDLFSGAVYCSDVMCFPPDFEGTAGIIHPDDLNHVKAALPLIRDGEAVSLQFRMITTYGEVKTISGDNIACPENSPNNEFVPHQPIFEEQINKLVIQHESDFYDQRLRLVDISERL